jgi:hypothetical protein
MEKREKLKDKPTYITYSQLLAIRVSFFKEFSILLSRSAEMLVVACGRLPIIGILISGRVFHIDSAGSVILSDGIKPKTLYEGGISKRDELKSFMEEYKIDEWDKEDSYTHYLASDISKYKISQYIDPIKNRYTDDGSTDGLAYTYEYDMKSIVDDGWSE